MGQGRDSNSFRPIGIIQSTFGDAGDWEPGTPSFRSKAEFGSSNNSNRGSWSSGFIATSGLSTPQERVCNDCGRFH